jgi:hypothetical protein
LEKAKDAEKTTSAVKKLQKSVNSDTLADANDVLAGLKRNLEAEEREKQKEAIAEMDAKLKATTTEDAPAETEEVAEEPKAEEPKAEEAKKSEEATEEKPKAKKATKKAAAPKAEEPKAEEESSDEAKDAE